MQSYVKLIAAYADYLSDNPTASAVNRVQLAVSSRERIYASSDPLDDSAWYRVDIKATNRTDCAPTLHMHETPYDEYIGG